MTSPLPIIMVAAIPVIMAFGGLLVVLRHRRQVLAGVGRVQKSMKGRSSISETPDQRSESDLDPEVSQQTPAAPENAETDEDKNA